MNSHLKISPGNTYPPGVSFVEEGVNFCVFSRHATEMELNLYRQADSEEPFHVVKLKPEINRTFFFWHVLVKNLEPGVYYTWRVGGPDVKELPRSRFNRNKELVDPWARGVTHAVWNRAKSCDPDDVGRSAMRGMVFEDAYDWEGDKPLHVPLEHAVIYEMHVGGYTRHASANVSHAGTFSAVVEKIPYLQSLGVTHIELLPAMAFDEQDVPLGVAKRGLRNYWGYSTHSFYSPHPSYCTDPHAGAHQTEFRDMVKALHKAGIGVILDVVFNHTAEHGAAGPWINFKGFENSAFYQLDDKDPSVYRDYTGCGNTVNCNHPLVTQYIVNCLEFWVRKMHVDGFRFDLASVMARGEDGVPMYNAPVLWSIEFSRVLARTILIAEAWDAAGLYQVGAFPGFRWAEWNGKYRDVIRRFVKGDRGLIGEVATCIAGSSDLYEAQGRLPINSINFITSHDGFTLYDLVSYNKKHNRDNGENNRDGHDHNFSWNCGVEGETGDRKILELRHKQAKNFIAILFLSQGVPMILGGDEFLRTQRGNNNAYCQDNELSWFDWRLLETNANMLEFVKGMIRFRKRHSCLQRKRFLTGKTLEHSNLPDVTWHGTELHKPKWDDPKATVLAFTLSGRSVEEPHVHVVMNMSARKIKAELPPIESRAWHLAVTTAGEKNIFDSGEQSVVSDGPQSVEARSVVVYEAY